MLQALTGGSIEISTLDRWKIRIPINERVRYVWLDTIHYWVKGRFFIDHICGNFWVHVLINFIPFLAALAIRSKWVVKGCL